MKSTVDAEALFNSAIATPAKNNSDYFELPLSCSEYNEWKLMPKGRPEFAVGMTSVFLAAGEEEVIVLDRPTEKRDTLGIYRSGKNLELYAQTVKEEIGGIIDDAGATRNMFIYAMCDRLLPRIALEGLYIGGVTTRFNAENFKFRASIICHKALLNVHDALAAMKAADQGLGEPYHASSTNLLSECVSTAYIRQELAIRSIASFVISDI